MYSDKSIVLSKNRLFWLWKRAFDILFCILLLPILIIMIPLLFILNNFYNKGNIFYVQRRMGKDCIPFNIIKFRSMISQNTYIRGYNDPIEEERILPFGKILRNTRLDEIPQILNVLKGEMSLIGPRPDCYEHALDFINEIENYSARHCIRPGLSGLSFRPQPVARQTESACAFQILMGEPSHCELPRRRLRRPFLPLLPSLLFHPWTREGSPRGWRFFFYSKTA